MKTILAIDPGTEQSGVVLWSGSVEAAEMISNNLLLSALTNCSYKADLCVIEMIASMGMPVGKEVFETCVWIGKFLARTSIPTHRVYRRDIKLHLCGSPRAKDANIRQALIDKHGAPGTKKNPGKTYGIKSHLWSALAVADYAACHFLTPENPQPTTNK